MIRLTIGVSNALTAATGVIHFLNHLLRTILFLSSLGVLEKNIIVTLFQPLQCRVCIHNSAVFLLSALINKEKPKPFHEILLRNSSTCLCLELLTNQCLLLYTDLVASYYSKDKSNDAFCLFAPESKVVGPNSLGICCSIEIFITDIYLVHVYEWKLLFRPMT